MACRNICAGSVQAVRQGRGSASGRRSAPHRYLFSEVFDLKPTSDKSDSDSEGRASARPKHHIRAAKFTDNACHFEVAAATKLRPINPWTRPIPVERSLGVLRQPRDDILAKVYNRRDNN